MHQLTGSLNIEQVAELRRGLLVALDGDADLALDLSGGAGFDLAMAQLLCAVHHSARQRGRQVRLVEGLPMAASQLLQGAGFAGCRSCGIYSAADCLLENRA